MPQALRTVDLSTSTFTADPAAPRHLSPSAHDVHVVFGLGADDGTVAPADMAASHLTGLYAARRGRWSAPREDSNL